MGPLILCLVTFNGIFIIFDLFDHASKFFEMHVPPHAVLRYYLGRISTYSHWFVPASLMLATLYTMWNLSRNSEITAMRASGISFHKLTLPFFVIAALFALATAVNSEFLAPDLSVWSRRLKNNGFSLDIANSDVRHQHPYYNPVGRRMWIFDKVDVAEVAGIADSGHSVSVTQERPDGIREWTVSTGKALFLDGYWWFSSPTFIDYDINGSELPFSNAPMGAPRLVRMAELTETPRDMWVEVRPWETLSVRDMWRASEQDPVHDAGKEFDIHYRFGAPWACVVVTLLAIPGGLTTARQGVLTGLVTALAAFLGFYALTNLGMFLGRQEMIPILVAVWSPNAAFLALGGWMYSKLT